jgi:hypothetical protein
VVIPNTHAAPGVPLVGNGVPVGLASLAVVLLGRIVILIFAHSGLIVRDDVFFGKVVSFMLDRFIITRLLRCNDCTVAKE